MLVTPKVIDDFAAHLRANGRAKRTVRAYTYHTRRITDFAARRHNRGDGIARLMDVDVALLEDYLGRRDFRAHTRNHILGAVEAFFAFLIKRRQYHRPSPASEIQRSKVHRDKLYHLSRHQVRALLDAPKKAGLASILHLRDWLVLDLLYTGALRRAEAVALLLDQIKVRAHDVVITVLGKGSKHREVLLQGPIVAKLKAYLKRRGELARSGSPPTLLLSCRGKALHAENIYEIVRGWGAKVGFPKIWPHLLRASRATHLFRLKKPLAMIQALLGHTDPKVTLQYAHTSLLLQEELDYHPERGMVAAIVAKLRRAGRKVLDTLLDRDQDDDAPPPPAKHRIPPAAAADGAGAAGPRRDDAAPPLRRGPPARSAPR